jgi:hypothetical protein
MLWAGARSIKVSSVGADPKVHNLGAVENEVNGRMQQSWGLGCALAVAPGGALIVYIGNAPHEDVDEMGKNPQHKFSISDRVI